MKEIKKVHLIYGAFALILLIALFLRFFKLTTIPSGFHVDESSLGYNAYSILKTGRDEWGQQFPLYFGSFGEFRLPVYFYLTVLSVFLFGPTEFSVRVWAAIFGWLTIIISFFLVYQVMGEKFSKTKSLIIALTTAFFLTFEPLHLHFSRMGIEILPCLFFSLLGFFLMQINKKNLFFYNFLTLVSFILSLFTYHAARIFLPLFLFSLILISRQKRKINSGGILAGLLLILIFSFGGKGLARAKAVSIFNSQSGVIPVLVEKINEHKDFKTPFLLIRAIHNKVVDYSLLFLRNYFRHFSADFLFFIGDTHDKRFSLPFLGNFLLFELPFFIIGFGNLFKKKAWFFILWLALSPLGSALTFLSPSSSRSIFFMPAFQVLAAVGLISSFQFLKRKGDLVLNKIFIFMLGAFLFFNIILILDSYFIHQQVHQNYYWDYGFNQVALMAKKLEADYDKIVVGKTRSTYIHFLFFQQVDPHNLWQSIERLPPDKAGFQPAKKVGKYFFDPTCPLEDSEKRVLYLCEKEVNENDFTIIDKVDYRDGSLNIVIFERLEKKEE